MDATLLQASATVNKFFCKIPSFAQWRSPECPPPNPCYSGASDQLFDGTEANMELKSQYKIISGAPLEIEQTLNLLSKDGWRPVSMASMALPSVIAVILENKMAEESSVNVTAAFRETLAEDIQ